MVALTVRDMYLRNGLERKLLGSGIEEIDFLRTYTRKNLLYLGYSESEVDQVEEGLEKLGKQLRKSLT